MLVILDCSQASCLDDIELTVDWIRKYERKNTTEFFLVNCDLRGFEKLSRITNVESDSALAELRSKAAKQKSLLFLKCGARVSKSFLKRVASEASGKNFIFVTNEQSYDYCLNNNLSKAGEINIESELRLWAGSNGFACSSSMVDLIYNTKLNGQRFFNEFFVLAIARTKKIIFIKGGVKNLYKHEDKYTDDHFLYEKSWYLDLTSFWSTFFKSKAYSELENKRYLNLLFLYQVSWCFWHNYNFKDKTRLWHSEVDTFLSELASCLQFVTVDEIFLFDQTFSVNNLHQHYRIFLYKLKHDGAEPEFRVLKKDFVLEHEGKTLISAKKVPLDIELMDIEKGNLVLHCFYRFPIFENKIKAMTGGVEYCSVKHGNHINFKSMGVAIASDYDGIISIPIKDVRGSIDFYLSVNGVEIKLSIRFTRLMSKLHGIHSYWVYEGKVLRHNNKSIFLNELKTVNHILIELNYLMGLVFRRKNSAFLLRMLYWISKKYFSNKKIWIYFDKIYKAGDNGEYLYRFSKSMACDKYKHFYILREDVPDAQRFKREGISYVKYGSLLHKLLFLNSDLVFLTHTSVPIHHLGFGCAYELKDFYTYKVFCLQHGLTVQELPHLLSKKIDNIGLYSIASSIEKQNLSRPEYKFNDNVFVANGLARYDGLTRKGISKQILISPTWRNYLATPLVVGKARSYSQKFLNSSYCNLYSSLISNESFLSSVKKNGYKVVFLLHPGVSSQLVDFNSSKYVQILAATDDTCYESLLLNSSLLVTDYSGIQFDFAYMNKPILYYHPRELPPSYQEGEYKYETMALGEVYETEAKLVEAICRQIEIGCVVQEPYLSRINSFFYFRDNKNCKRIYDSAVRFMNGERDD